MNLKGKIVTSAYDGPFVEYLGDELPGITGDIWHYADLYLKFDDGSQICLAFKGKILDQFIKEVNPCIEFGTGNERDHFAIADILQDEEHDIFVIFENRMVLFYGSCPGGSYHQLSCFEDVLKECDKDDPLTSLIDGRVNSLGTVFTGDSKSTISQDM